MDEGNQMDPSKDAQSSLELGWLRESDEAYFLNTLDRSKGNQRLRIQLSIENIPFVMEVDSGACKSVIHINDYKSWFRNIPLEPVTFQLRVVTGESVNIVDQISVCVEYKKNGLPYH